ncbi:MAG: hypothetical protein NTX24_04180 [Candidatus Pacearchaeota archaeon]|nr:hypothetical protein [Candidatus Pacearchaeota archaeon]
MGGITQTDDAETLSQREREFKEENRVTISIDGTPHVFGLSDAGTFYRGTLLSDGNLSLRGTLITTDDPITFERWVYGIHANERVSSALVAYLSDRHPEMK